MAVVAVVACAAGGLETLSDGLVAPLLTRGHRVSVTVTPSAHTWLRDTGADGTIRELTGHTVRSAARLPREPSPLPAPDLIVCAPATANTVAKLALGIADNQALTLMCENVGTKPMVVFPRINAGHARQPAWQSHIDALGSAGVELVYGQNVWPPFEPRRSPPRREVPWDEIVRRAEALLH